MRQLIRRYSRQDLTACGWGVTFYFLMVLALFALIGRTRLLGMVRGFTLGTGGMFARLLTRAADRQYGS